MLISESSQFTYHHIPHDIIPSWLCGHFKVVNELQCSRITSSLADKKWSRSSEEISEFIWSPSFNLDEMESNLPRIPRLLSASLLKLCLRSFHVLGFSVTEMILPHSFIGFNEHKPAENTTHRAWPVWDEAILLVCHHSNVSASTEHKGAEAAIRADGSGDPEHNIPLNYV